MKFLRFLPYIAIFLLTLGFFHLQRELRFFQKKALAFKKQEPSRQVNGDELLPAQLIHVPYMETLGTKTITIRGISNPYNPAILKREDGRYDLFFRYDVLDENKQSLIATYIGYAELDDTFSQTAQEAVVVTSHTNSAEDARVLKTQNEPLLVYNDQVANKRVMHVATWDRERLALKDIKALDPLLQSKEKNWVPLEYCTAEGGSEIYFQHTLAPHKLIHWKKDQPVKMDYMAPSYSKKLEAVMWPRLWGRLRGGTPAQKVGDEYLAFFHSSFSDQDEVQWYCMGACTFEAHPPFRITSVSAHPLLFKGIYTTPFCHTVFSARRVIFPSGFIIEEHEGREVIQLFCGENDSAIKMVTLDKQELLSSLKRIERKAL